MKARTLQADFVEAARREAWAFGRSLRDELLSRFNLEYNLTDSPPPALIVDELLRDFLEFDLRFDPLALDVFAQTTWEGGRTIVTINSLIRDMPGVKDAEGVQRVTAWHEGVHGLRDVPENQPGLLLPGFEPPAGVLCYRSGRSSLHKEREFWAEEAGRAAAVSYSHLMRSEAFTEFRGFNAPNARLWHLLRQAAKDIGVNISALVTQLQAEGWITVSLESGKQVVRVQPELSRVAT